MKTAASKLSDLCAGAMTACGASLFLIGFVNLLLGSGVTAADTDSCVFLFKIAGLFVTGGWVSQHGALLKALIWQPAHRLIRGLRPLFRLSADGVLVMMVTGICFIVLALLGMGGLWLRTVR